MLKEIRIVRTGDPESSYSLTSIQSQLNPSQNFMEMLKNKGPFAEMFNTFFCNYGVVYLLKKLMWHIKAENMTFRQEKRIRGETGPGTKEKNIFGRF